MMNYLTLKREVQDDGLSLLFLSVCATSREPATETFRTNDCDNQARAA